MPRRANRAKSAALETVTPLLPVLTEMDCVLARWNNHEISTGKTDWHTHAKLGGKAGRNNNS